MTSELEQLVQECRLHYQDREFPDSALEELEIMLRAFTISNQIDIDDKENKYDYRNSVTLLLGKFERCPWESVGIDLANAAFGFACGYQIREGAVTPYIAEDRIPGKNNTALADQARELYLNHHLDLYLQHEIAIATPLKGVAVNCKSDCADQNTIQVLEHFINHYRMNNERKKPEAVLVIAHRHHYDRCRLLLEDRSIRAIPNVDQYYDYDPLEAQDRVKSAEVYIVSDFFSMANRIAPSQKRSSLQLVSTNFVDYSKQS